MTINQSNRKSHSSKTTTQIIQIINTDSMKKLQTNMHLHSSLVPSQSTPTVIETGPVISDNNKCSTLSALYLKILSAFILGLFFFTSCQKDDFMPVPPQANVNTGTLKAGGTIYYVALTGNDVTGNGSVTSPWRSLYKACQSVTVSGSVIHIKAGTYSEANQCTLAVGVSLEGDGVNSIIQCTRVVSRIGGTSSGSISLLSTTQGTNGNQSISNLKLDGINKGTIGIVVGRRSNVKIHDITITNFLYNGITFNGGSSQVTTPTTFATGNEIYNVTGTDCGSVPATPDDYSKWVNGGIIAFSGQSGFLMHHNILTNTGRKPYGNDNTLSIGYPNKGSKIYNNKSTKLTNDAGWNFHFEFWNSWGGVEIYNNDFYGGKNALDLSGSVASFKGSYDYSFSVHNNRFYNTGASSTSGRYTITIEGVSTCDIIIYENYFLDCGCPIAITEGSFNNKPIGASELRNIRIYKNVMESCGYDNSGIWSNIISMNNSAVGSKMSDIHIYNNVIKSDITRNAGIKINVSGSGAKASNININNNIITDCTNGTFLTVINKGAIDGLNVNNNVLYGNAGSNNPTFSGNAVANYKFLNNVKSNPLFISNTDFHLQSASPAKDAGINVGLAYMGTAPDIGAFEYSAAVQPVITNQTPIILNQSFQLYANSPIYTTVGKINASDPDAGQTLTYSILSGNTNGAFSINASTGTLTVANTSALNFSTTPSFSLLVKVQDNASNQLSKQATISVSLINVITGSAAGKITYQNWNNIGSSNLVSSLTGNINYPNNPSSTIQITSMEATSNKGDNTGSRISGYIYAPVSGNYTFWIASDDTGELWLSTNDQPANKRKVAYHNGATLPRQWNKYATQKSIAINLIKGQKYYIEALMKERSGSDNLAVGWLKPGQSSNLPSEVIPGSVLSPR